MFTHLSRLSAALYELAVSRGLLVGKQSGTPLDSVTIIIRLAVRTTPRQQTDLNTEKPLYIPPESSRSELKCLHFLATLVLAVAE